MTSVILNSNMRLLLALLSILSSQKIMIHSSITNSNDDNECGTRYKPLSTNSSGLTTTVEDPASFPWLARIDINDGETLKSCIGSMVSRTSVLTSASCISTSKSETITVATASSSGKVFNVESILIHPDFNELLQSGKNDLALLKLKNVQSNDFISRSCVPEIGDDPVEDGCSVAAVANGTVVVARPVKFGPSVACIEREGMKGFFIDSESVVCTEEEGLCGDKVISGPAFCSVRGRFHLIGLPAEGSKAEEGGRADWCGSGAMTRIAKYSPWIRANIEIEVKGEQERQQHDYDYDYGGGTPAADVAEAAVEAEAEAGTPCAAKPCGEKAVCWNSGSNYMCTCHVQFPRGNPYFACHKCLYDEHCKGGAAKCVNNSCEAVTSQQTKQQQQVKIDTSQYRKVGDKSYFVSDDERLQLPWPQAQYECLGRNGFLAEPTDAASASRLSQALRQRVNGNTTGSYWVGASDFEEEGKFRWFHNGSVIDQKAWGVGKDRSSPEKDQRCVQLSAQGARWEAHSCEFASSFVCELGGDLPDSSPSINNNNNGLAGSSSGSAREERQQNQFDTLNPKANYKDICGRRFVRQRRIVGGGIARRVVYRA